MKTLKFSVLALVLGAVAILGVSRFSGTGPTIRTDANLAGNAVAAGETGRVQTAVNPSQPPAARVENSPVVSATTQQPKVATPVVAEDAFTKGARVLNERASAPTADGRQQKTRLLEIPGAKYPFVRSEEVWKRDAVSGAEELESRTLMVADHVLIKLSDGLTKQELETFVAAAGGKVRRQIGQTRNYLVATSEVSLDAYETMSDRLRGVNSPATRVEPDYVVNALFTPNDPDYAKLWGLNNISQTGGTGDADIDAPEAWDVSRGNTSITVGVIDTGIDYTHPDLEANIWTNPGEIPGNGIDDDHNGYIDDVHGWDFVNNDSNPMDDHYHGTHCAGTIGGVGNNGIGVIGVSPSVKMMALKFLSSTGGGYTSDAVEAVSYATANGARITSNSWGGGGYSQALKDSIDEAAAAGVLFVAAAGNSSSNNDQLSQYPASYLSPNIIAVAATDHRDQLAYFSSYGAASVHLSAPGVDIYSTSPGNTYRYLSGTSMATPHVSGAAALLLSVRSDWHWAELKSALLKSVDPIVALRGKVITGGRLNIGRALMLNNGPYVSVVAVTSHDAPADGGAGNADGIISPGEDIALRVRVQNAGSQPALSVVTTASIVSGGNFVGLMRNASGWGNILVGEEKTNADVPLLVRVSANAPSPLVFTVRLVTSTATGLSWSTDASFTVSRVSLIQGRVATLTGSTPVAGAVVTAKSALVNTQAVTNASGVYQLSVLDGTYALAASAAGFNTAAAVTVSVPPSNTNLDFALGRSRLQISPSGVSSTQLENTVTTQPITLTNTGDQPLTVSITGSAVVTGASSDGLLSLDTLSALGSVDAAELPSGGSPVSATATYTPLPLDDDFEDGVLDGWDSGSGVGERQIVSGISANGTRSFRFRNNDGNAHYNGIQRDFAPSSKPGYVSFWVRPGSTTDANGYVTLSDGTGDTIVFYAKENGRLQVNGDTGGDNSYIFGAGNWYHIEFRTIDWTNRRFDYFVNGALIKAAVPFRRASSDIRRISLYNFSSGTEAWWDDVRVLDHSAGWLAYSPRSLTLAPGQSTQVTVTLDSTDLAAGTYQGRLEFISNDSLTPRSALPVTLNVQAVPNTAPVATSQTLTFNEDTAATITLNGTDAEGGALTAFIATLPASGTLYQTSNGTTLGTAITQVPTAVSDAGRRVIYVPTANANGSPLASFTFTLMDRRSASAPGTITLNVSPVNDIPLASDDIANAAPSTVITSINVLANDTDADGDTLTITSFTQGIKGTVTLNADKTLKYAPSAGFTSGSDQFTYTVTDGKGGTATARVTVVLGFLAGGNWPMQGANPGHTGYYPASLGSGSFVKNWSLPYGRALNAVSIGEGRAFVTATTSFTEPYLAAVRMSTGTEDWRQTFPSAYSITGPSYQAGSLYFQRNNGGESQLWAINASNGALQWKTPYPSQWATQQQPTVTATTVYAPTGYYGGLGAFNRVTGASIYAVGLPQIWGWSPAVSNDIAYTQVAGTLTAHNATTGAALWTLATGGASYYGQTMTILGNRAYFINFAGGPGELLCVDLDTRAVVWRAAGTFAPSTNPSISNGLVYAIENLQIRSFNAATGAPVSTYATSEAALMQPVLTNDTLIAASAARVWIWNLSTGALRQTLTPGGYLSLADGNLLVAGTTTAGLLDCYGVSGTGRTPPAANPQTVSGTEDQLSVITLTGNDTEGDALTAIVTVLPITGTLYQTDDGVNPSKPILSIPAIVSNTQRKVIYRPLADDFGLARAAFSFRMADLAFNSTEAVVTINLAPVNDAPIAKPDVYQIRPGHPLQMFRPAANDLDVDGDLLTVASTSTPARGTLVSNADGSLGYTPSADFTSGSDTFDYTITDAAGVSSTSTITIEINTNFRNDWPTFGGSPAHENYYRGALGVTPFDEIWTYTATAAVNAPTVADGRVYLTVARNQSAYTHAYALDNATGAEVWRVQFPPSFSLNQPSWFAGRVHFQRGHSDETQIFALDAATGTQVWQTLFGGQWETYLAPAIDSTGIYINGGTYGGIYGFTTNAGTQKFFTQLDQVSGWTPVLAGDGLYAFVRGRFMSFNRSTGALLWTLNLNWGGSSNTMGRTIAYSEGTAYVINDLTLGSELVAIDLEHASVLWRISGSFAGTPAVANGIVYAASAGVVKTYAASNGRVLREYVAPAETTLLKTPLITDDLLLVSSATKTYFFNLTTRAVIQTVAAGGNLAVADNSIFLSGTDNVIRRFGRAPALNHVPSAKALGLDIREEASVAIQLSGTDADGDELSFVVRKLPAKGKLYQTTDGTTRGELITSVPALVRHPAGYLIYDAPLDLFGTAAESFNYTANDYASSSAEAAVVINLSPVNDAPIAMPDTVSLRPGEVLSNFRPERNDRDVDGDVLRITSFTQPSNGTVTVSADGSLQYTPATGFVEGDDAFNYTISDPAGLTGTATVKIIVSATRGREWTMYGGGLDHSGYLPLSLAGSTFTPRWSNAIGTNIKSLAIAANRVYVASYTAGVQRLTALDVGAGSEVWHVDYPAYSLNPPAYHDGHVFLQAGNSSSSRLFAVRADNGASVWAGPFSAQSESYLAPSVDATGAYINGGTYGGMYRFNRETGAQVFFIALDQISQWTPLRHQGGLYTFLNGRLRSHNVDTGAVTGTLTLTSSSSTMMRAMSAENGVAFVMNVPVSVPSGARDLVAVNLATLTTKWTVRDTAFGYTTPAVADGVVYMIAGNTVRSFASSDGTPLRTFVTSDQLSLQFQPIVTNDTLIACSGTKTYIFNLSDGTLRQTLPYGGSIALAGDSLYIVSADTSVRAYGIPNPLNRPPAAQSVTVTTNEDTSVAVTLAATDADGNALTCSITRLPVQGALHYTTDGVTPGARITTVPALVGNAPTRVLYVPPQNANGAGLGNFGFAASDGLSLSPEASVTLNVTPVNDGPVAENDFRVIQPGQILSPIRERANDLDVDGDALTIVSFTQPSAGMVKTNADGTLRFESPKTATSGRYTFNYTVADPSGLQSSATVTIEVAPDITGLWPTQGGNAQRSGYAPVTLGSSLYSVRWSRTIGTNLNAVAIGDGVVFASAKPASGPVLVALDERSGTPKWERTFASSYSFNPPTYDRGLVYVQRGNSSSDSQLLSLSASNGTTAWSAPFAAQWEAYLAPLVLDDGVFTNAGTYGGLYGHQRLTGGLRFFSSLTQMDRWTPAASAAGELFSFVRGVLTQHDKTTGSALWSVNLGWGGYGYSMNRTVALEDRRAFVINDSPSAAYSDEDLVAVDLNTRLALWSINGEFTGSPSVAQGTVYAISADTVQARSASTGRLLATYTAASGEPLAGQPVITEDLVIVASAQRTYLFGRHDRNIIQVLPAGGAISVADDQVLIADPSSGVLRAYATQPAISFTPAGGTFAQPVNITLGAREAGARIYYTLDGTAPDFTSPWVSSGASVLMKWTGKVRAIMVSGSGVSRINEVSVTMIDSDADGLPDWWEKDQFGSLNNTTGNTDSDGDGRSDADEFTAGTNPLDRGDAFTVRNVHFTTGGSAGMSAFDFGAQSTSGLSISWDSKADRYYTVEASNNLQTWTTVGTPFTGNGAPLSYTHPDSGATRMFLRVRVQPLLIDTAVP